MAAITLINLKYPHNLGAVIRAASAYGAHDVMFTGTRAIAAIESLKRIPREERMKGYSNVKWKHEERPFDACHDLVPVAVEVRENSIMLPHFDHPPNAMYVFGPEDGGLKNVTLRHCHHFVAIPTNHCLNLSMAVGTVLYDRQMKLDPDKRLDMTATEGRGYVAT